MFNSLAFFQRPCNGWRYEGKQEILAKLDYPFNSPPIGRAHNSWHATHVSWTKVPLRCPMNLIGLDFLASLPKVLKLISTLRCFTLKNSPKWSFDCMNIIPIALERRLVYLWHYIFYFEKKLFFGLGQPGKMGSDQKRSFGSLGVNAWKDNTFF